MNYRLKRQIDFLKGIDIKSVFRRTCLFDNSRQDNDAEHCWYLAVMAIVFAKYSNQAVDISKVIKMVLIHDIVEIETGDLLLYKRNYKRKSKKERLAAKRFLAFYQGSNLNIFINYGRNLKIGKHQRQNLQQP